MAKHLGQNLGQNLGLPVQLAAAAAFALAPLLFGKFSALASPGWPAFFTVMAECIVLGPAAVYAMAGTSVAAYVAGSLPSMACLLQAMRQPGQRQSWAVAAAWCWFAIGAAAALAVATMMFAGWSTNNPQAAAAIAAVVFATTAYGAARLQVINAGPRAVPPALLLLLSALICTVASVAYPRTYIPQPCPAVLQRDTGPCNEALPAGGFPLAYLYDVPGISVQGMLGPEDRFSGGPFLADFAVHLALLCLTAGVFGGRIKWREAAAP
jgi:lysylphosphatidylglycerol synthetase-like protein (DUF2156 family)